MTSVLAGTGERAAADNERALAGPERLERGVRRNLLHRAEEVVRVKLGVAAVMRRVHSERAHREPARAVVDTTHAVRTRGKVVKELSLTRMEAC
jgi:hypothetical protein